MPLERFLVPHGMPPVVVSGAPHGPGEPFDADPETVARLVRSGGVEPAPVTPPKAARARQEAEA